MLQEDNILRNYSICFDTYSDKDVILEYFDKKGYDIDDYNYERKKTVFYDKDAEMYYFNIWSSLDLSITNVSGYPQYDLNGLIHGTIRIALVSSESMPVGGETSVTQTISGTDTIITSISTNVLSDRTITSTVTYTLHQNGTSAETHSITISYANGSSDTNQQQYDEDGNLTNEHNEHHNSDGSYGEEDIIYNNDGSSESTATNYDENGIATDGYNQWTDPIGNQNTQSFEYDDNGENPVVVGYTIDTSGNSAGTGETLEEAVNTGFIAFDGRSFEITADFEFACNDQGTTYFKTLLSALEPAANGTYNGFYIRNGGIDSSISNSNKYKFTFFARSNSGITFGSNGRGDGYTFGSTCYLRKIIGRYQMTVTYRPGTTSGSFTANIKPTYANGDNSPTAAGTTISASNNNSIPPTMDNAQIILGGNGVSHNFDIVNMTVYSFNVRKL